MLPSSASEPYRGPDPNERNQPRRAVEAATLVIIAATVVAVVASSWPLFATWLEPERPHTARPGIARTMRARGWAVSSPRRPDSQYAPRPRVDTRRFPTAPPVTPSAKKSALTGRVAKPITIVQLLADADPGAKPVVSVNPNETLIVVQEMSPWMLLAVRRDGKMRFGWTTEDQVRIAQ